MKVITRRAALATGVGTLALGVSRAAAQVETKTLPERLFDSSGLDPVRVARHITMREPADAALIARVREEIASARASGRPFCASAARHSQGGHSLAQDGACLTLDQPFVELDRSNMRYRVAAGARWRDVIPALDRDFSPLVMQSNNDFGVAATFSVNAHGWAVPFGPFGSSVRSLRMVLASGDLVVCSRQHEPEIFGAAMGGYGLLGVIIDLDVAMTSNLMLEPSDTLVDGRSVGPAIAAAVREPSMSMCYGRLDISRAGFLEEARLVRYRPASVQPALPPAAGFGAKARVARTLFRRQRNSEGWKRFRWGVESHFGAQLSGASTRNALIHSPASALAGDEAGRTDILHEYFLPPERFGEFLDACKVIIPTSRQELLNVTLRYVDADRQSLLPYAPEERIAAVMLFTQARTEEAEVDMMAMTRALIDAALNCGGNYYLPYRPHARPDQFRRAYPNYERLLAIKRMVDPGGVFSNGFYRRFLAG